MVSDSGDAVRASNGMWVSGNYRLANFPRADFVIVLEGNLPTQNISASMRGALRNAYRHGSMIIGVDTGAFAIAAAGPHRQSRGSSPLGSGVIVSRAFSRAAKTKNQIYCIRSSARLLRRGVATLDMMLDLIGRLRGAVPRQRSRQCAHPFAAQHIHPQRTDDQAGTAMPSLSRRIVA